MNIGLSALEFDPAGALMLEADEVKNAHTVERRATKVRVMDGVGVSVTDRGVFAGDQEWTVRWTGGRHRAAVKRLVELNAQLCVTTLSGVYHAIPMRYSEDGATSELILSITEAI